MPRDNRCNKLFVKTRRTVPQKLDSFDSSIKKDAQELKQFCSIPKPVIHDKRLNQVNGSNVAQEISAQHEAMINYVHSSWRCIKQELEYSNKQQTPNGDSHSTTNSIGNGSAVNGSAATNKIKYISGCTTSSIPKNFVPFDLESFWGQRIYQNLLQSS